MKREEALKIAEKKGLDLIEISPSANPPVARIFNFDKFRYEEEKKLKKQQKLQKSLDIKQVQISVREARNDLDIKANRVEAFLKDGHGVTIAMVLRGREKANKDWALKKLDEFLKILKESYVVSMPPRWGGRGFAVQIGPKSTR